MRDVLKCVAELSATHTALDVGHELRQVLLAHFDVRRDFTDVKHHFNQLLLSAEGGLRDRLEAAPDPLELATRMALVANLIDFGPTGEVDEGRLFSLMDEAPELAVDADALSDLLTRMRGARTIVLLTDNCGEVVCDRLLIEEIIRANPSAEVLAIVRGAAVSNDATMEDAEEAGLTRVCRVVSNGWDRAGSDLSRVSDEARRAIEGADLVISKGLANFETLRGEGANVYFLFLCKCALYVEAFGVPLHTPMVVRGTPARP